MTKKNYDFSDAGTEELKKLLKMTDSEKLKTSLLRIFDKGLSHNQYLLLHEACDAARYIKMKAKEDSEQ